MMSDKCEPFYINGKVMAPIDYVKPKKESAVAAEWYYTVLRGPNLLGKWFTTDQINRKMDAYISGEKLDEKEFIKGLEEWYNAST